MSAPFEPTSTPAIERANRLLSLRSNPGFSDLMRISQDLVDTAVQTCIQYPGWDPQVMVVLKVRMQIAQEHHDMILAKITEAIREGVQEQAANTNLLDKSITEVLEQGDYVRQEVLTHFSALDQESRLPGTY